MSLLPEFAITPDVFDSGSYAHPEVCRVCLSTLAQVMMNDGIVRDIADGSWSRYLMSNDRAWHSDTRRMIKFLRPKRLRRGASISFPVPESDQDWCREAILSHNSDPLWGIIAADGIAKEARAAGELIVGAVSKLEKTSWWPKRNDSLELPRTREAYLAALDLVMRVSNSAMFIDPHIDPRQGRYQTLLDIMQLASERSPSPPIEIHRVCYFNTSDKRDSYDLEGWCAVFAPWRSTLISSGQSVEVFIWDDFHDRYLVSDVIGVKLPNGFDTTTNSADMTLWTRLSSNARDNRQREFHPTTGRHNLLHRFRVE